LDLTEEALDEHRTPMEVGRKSIIKQSLREPEQELQALEGKSQACHIYGCGRRGRD
jgi:hypothetical protein